MPILNDIMDHPVLGRERKRGIEIGRKEGREEGERRIILGQIGQRFGAVPPAVEKRIQALPASKLERIALRLLDTGSLEDLLR